MCLDVYMHTVSQHEGLPSRHSINIGEREKNFREKFFCGKKLQNFRFYKRSRYCKLYDAAFERDS